MSAEENLRQLVSQACGHSPGTPQRQRLLTQIIRITTPRLWRDSSPHYQDALQQTWLYFCRNLCEGITGQVYDPDYGTVVTWLNAYLKRRLQDFYINQQKEQARRVSPVTQQSRSGEESELLNPIDNVAATPSTPPMLDIVRMWAEADENGDLRATCIQGHPNVNCQTLILKRLPPEAGWKDLAKEFGLSISTLSSFYQRQCIPRLRDFAEDEGFL